MTDLHVIQRQKAAAEMLMKCGYPQNVLDEMRRAYNLGDYNRVQEIAGKHDIRGREDLDAKISMVANPNFKEEIDVQKLNNEIKDRFVEFLTLQSMDELERGEAVKLSENQLSQMQQPSEVEDPNPRYLFKVEGIDAEFASASKAMIAYKEKHGLAPKPTVHSFRRTIVYTGVVDEKIKNLEELRDLDVVYESEDGQYNSYEEELEALYAEKASIEQKVKAENEAACSGDGDQGSPGTDDCCAE